jgi:sirohydrochlorin cobaltochelatase
MPKTALILAGHGSHVSSQTADVVWRHVDALRAMGVADEVAAAFWKEMPSFHAVLNTLTADDVTVIPMFTAQGYFTQTVIPAEMGLRGALTHRNGRLIRYTRTLSEHPYLSQVVRQRVEDAVHLLGCSTQQTAVAIIGHSTRRNPESRKATEAQAAQIQKLGIAAQVEAVYLDDSPGISEIYGMTNAPCLIAVPYFLAAGSHTTFDVPGELGLEPGQTRGQINGREVYYTLPVGIEETLRDAVLELAREAGAPLYSSKNGSEWDCFPAAGWGEFVQVVESMGAVRFGQLHVTTSEIRVWGDDNPVITLHEPRALRARVRENPFRSLAASADLPSGWRIPLTGSEQLCAAVETVYPGAIADWAANRQKRLQINRLEETLRRQTGNYRQLVELETTWKMEIVQDVCGGCVRHPTWFTGQSSEDTIPCCEACNHWLSQALEKMT